MLEISELRSKYASKIDELDATTRALEEVKARPTLLGACPVCPSLRQELEEKNARIRNLETSKSPLPACDACPALTEIASELYVDKTLLEDENTYLRVILGWVSSREPQLGIIIGQFKKGNGFGVGYDYT